MKFTYTSVRNPRWANKEHTVIECEVKFDHLKHEGPFSAFQHDIDFHGQEIFSRCAKGEFGQVGSFHERATSAKGASVTPAYEVPAWPGWPQMFEFINEANAENSRGTTRGIILVWANMIEELLGDILEVFLVEHSVSREAIWDESQSSLRSFSGRAKIAFCLGLISKDELRTCDQVRDIRNAAAHKWQVSLANPEFAKKALPAFKGLYQDYSSNTLVFCENDLEFLVKLVYGGACGSLASKLAKRQTEAAAERRQKKLSG